jgi:WD40 repeat protein
MGIVGQHPNEMPVEQMAVSRDGKFLASISHDESIRFWDLAYFGKPELTKEQREASLLQNEADEIDSEEEVDSDDDDSDDDDEENDEEASDPEDYTKLFEETDEDGQTITFSRTKLKRRMHAPNQRKKELKTFFKDFK